MKTIHLTQGQHTIVDDDDYERLTALGSWHYDRYAKRIEAKWDKRSKTYNKRVVYMHRLIVNAADGLHVDHLNGDKLDNRKSNLQVCTARENAIRQQVYPKRGSSRFKGVSYDKRRNKWKAVIGHNYKRIDIGRFNTEQEAADAYDTFSKKLHGKQPITNRR
jgi:hypothetical protein